MLIAYVSGVILATRSLDPDRVWLALGVPPMGQPFADLTVIGSAHHTLDSGGHVFAPMAADPWHRSYNYPVLWLALPDFSQKAVPALAAAMILAWLTAVARIVGRLTVPQGVMLGALLCSPVVTLAIERANTDLIVFSLVAIFLLMLQQQDRTSWAWGILLTGAALKLFPVFAAGSLLRLGWRRCWPWLVATAAAIAVLCLIQLDEIFGVIRETPRGAGLSYGAVAWINRANYLYALNHGVMGVFDSYRLPSILCAALLLGTTFLAGLRSPSRMAQHIQSGRLDAFRAGAGIFLATFLFGSHYVYRLAFLLFCLPWLIAESPTHATRARRIALALIVAIFCINPLLWSPLHLVRDALVWMLAGILAWLLGTSMPRIEITRQRSGAVAAIHAS